MKRKLLTLALFSALVLLPSLLLTAACGESVKAPIPDDGGDSGDGSADLIKRQDEEDLVGVSIENGAASIYFNLDRWDELHNIYDVDPEYYDMERMEGGPFPIAVESGLVKDAVIGKVPLLDYSSYEFTVPVVVFLIDDDSLEWIYADPYMAVDDSHLGGGYRNYKHFVSSGTIARKDDYTHFPYEFDKEGIGGKTSILPIRVVMYLILLSGAGNAILRRDLVVQTLA